MICSRRHKINAFLAMLFWQARSLIFKGRTRLMKSRRRFFPGLNIFNLFFNKIKWMHEYRGVLWHVRAAVMLQAKGQQRRGGQLV